MFRFRLALNKKRIVWGRLNFNAVGEKFMKLKISRRMSWAMALGVCVWSLVIGAEQVHAITQSNVFSGTLLLHGDISEFFDSSGNPLVGVTVSNSAAPAIPGQPGTAGLAKSPMGVLGSQTGQYHPSGYNQRRLMAAYNPFVNGGTIYVGVDLPGGTGSAANPD